jgi:hypothetical protein
LAPEELFSELFREFAIAPRRPIDPPRPTVFNENGELLSAEDKAARNKYLDALEHFAKSRALYEEALESSSVAKPLFEDLLLRDVSSEKDAIAFLERAAAVVQSLDNQEFESYFVTLVARFIGTFNLRYDVGSPYGLQVNLAGLFATLMSELKTVATGNAHLTSLFSEVEDAIGDSIRNPTPGHIKSCLVKQFNFAEALAQNWPGVNANTLSDMCNQINSWPHVTLREALKKLYGMRSDYPGISHGGNATAAQRDLDMRDLLAVSILLVGFSPYIAHNLNMATIRGTA